MTNKTEGTLSIIASMLVLFSAMLDPIISMVLAAVFLLGLGVYHITRKSNDR